MMTYDQGGGHHSTFKFAKKSAKQGAGILGAGKLTLGVPFYGACRSGCRVSGVGCRVSGVGCRVSGLGLGFRVQVFEFGRSRALARTNRDIVTALTIAPAVYVQEYCTSNEYLISSSNVTSGQPSPSHQRSARKNIAPVRNI
jgi:hypothetical protein